MSESTLQNQAIGTVTSGGLKENLHVRLNGTPQQVQEGSFVVIDSQDWRFYGIATDLQLQSIDPRYALEPSRARLPEKLADLLDRQTLYTNLVVLPALMLERGPEPDSPDYAGWRTAIDSGKQEEPRPMPVKSIPTHHAEAFLAGAGDVAEIFGKPEDEGNFVIGHTREQDHPVCVNLDKFIQRSSGIFGATGSGKSFLTRMLLAGLIDHNRASVLVYDMHNEYGLDDTASDTGENVRGLRSGFGRRQGAGGWAGRQRHHPRQRAGFQPGAGLQRHPAGRRGTADARTEPERDHCHRAGRAGSVAGQG